MAPDHSRELKNLTLADLPRASSENADLAEAATKKAAEIYDVDCSLRERCLALAVQLTVSTKWSVTDDLSSFLKNTKLLVKFVQTGE